MSTLSFIVDVLIGLSAGLALYIIPVIICNVDEKREFRRECKEMFDFYDKTQELIDNGKGDLAWKLIEERNKAKADENKQSNYPCGGNRWIRKK